MTKKFNTLVFVGRMQPFHKGHKAVIDKALEHAFEVVIVLGSAKQPRTIRNPFTTRERAQMISAVYPKEVTAKSIKIVEVMDYPYDDNAWVSAVQTAVNSVKTVWKKNLGVGLIGHSKDHSSYYLNIFPDWRNHVEVENIDGINATDIRNHVLSGKWEPLNILYPTMPKESVDVMDGILYANKYGTDDEANFTPVGDYLIGEYFFVKDYKDKWSEAPYAPTFVTTDAVLTQSGYILLVKRGEHPYKDCWALPGGYLEQGLNIEDNMIKELREETQVKVPAKVLKGSIRNHAVFDHPERDPRGRTITHGFHVDLGYPSEKLPKVKGSDDAADAKWIHLSEVKPYNLAFDHYSIISRFIRV
jgi:bifunctional NMN adenylyltransferase/nudix hydrolase